MTQYELESRWIGDEGLPGVSIRYSDLVRIKSGEHSEETAEVIALISLDPEPTYVVVLPPNEESAVLLQSQLESTGSSGGRTLILVPPGEN